MEATIPRTPSMRLDGRRALVTGAGRGIGLGAAAALAGAGAHVVLAARSAEEIEAAAAAIRSDSCSSPLRRQTRKAAASDSIAACSTSMSGRSGHQASPSVPKWPQKIRPSSSARAP
jgi:NAD(P)-dependent dehydrogenase (short-subunit alcohol dehydrogenase family)